MTLHTFGLQYDLPDADISKEGRTIVTEQAHTLESLLHRAHQAVAGVNQRTGHPQDKAEALHAVAAQTERDLAEEAQIHVKIEQDIALLRSMFTDPTNLPLESAQRLRSMEQANAVLHANLAAARGALETMVERPGSAEAL